MIAREFCACCIAIALSVTPVAATKTYLPTATNLAGAWIGTVDGRASIRLVLDSSGEGQVAIRSYSGTVFVYDIEGVEFDRYKVRIEAVSEDSEQPRLTLRGKAWPLKFVVQYSFLRGKHKTRLWRETEHTEAIDALISAMIGTIE